MAPGEIGPKGLPGVDPVPVSRPSAAVESHGGPGGRAGEEGGSPRRPPTLLPEGSETEVSGLASTLAALRQLQEARPDLFRAVLARIAEALLEEAGAATGPEAAWRVHLAERFRRGAEDGSLPSLDRPGSPTSPGAALHPHVQSYADRQAPAGEAGVELARLIHRAMREGGAPSLPPPRSGPP